MITGHLRTAEHPAASSIPLRAPGQRSLSGAPLNDRHLAGEDVVDVLGDAVTLMAGLRTLRRHRPGRRTSIVLSAAMLT